MKRRALEPAPARPSAAMALPAAAPRAGRRRRACRPARAGGRHRHPHRGAGVRRAGIDRPRRQRDDPRRQAADQPLGEPGRRARPAGTRPAELRPGRAALDPRLRRALDLRHPRRAPVCRRHPGDPARRPGPDHQRRARLDRSHRGAARPVLGALRQLVGRRDPGVQRGGARPADALGRRQPVGSYDTRRASPPRRAAPTAASATSSARACSRPTATATTAPPSASSATPSSPGSPTTRAS